MKGMRSLILFESKFYVLHKVLNYVRMLLPVFLTNYISTRRLVGSTDQANSTTSANFRSFFVHSISYTPTDLSLLKGVSKIFIILFEQDCPEAVVHE